MRLGIHRKSGMQRASLMSAVVVFAASLFHVAPAVAQAATTWVVNGSNPDCDDFGAGNQAEPLCTMLRATIVAGPGDTVQVHPGTYREQLHPASGTAGAPVRFEATGPGVRIVGSRDVSDPAQWTQFAGNVWSRPYINPSGQPQMMFADDTLLTKGTDVPTLGPDQWFWDNVAKVLYANTGGGNPGTGHTIEVGALSYGFQLGGKTHVIIDGFEFSRQNFHAVNIGPSSAGDPAGTLEARNLFVEESGSYGINVDDSNSGNIDLVGNEVTKAGSHGIRLRNASNVDVLGNVSHDNLNSGFAVHAASGNRLVANTAYGNDNPRIRSANGIDVNSGIVNGATVGSSNNVFRNNLLYDNQDSGLQVYNGSDNNVVVRNISHGNGDHGLDTLRSTGTRYISNTSYGNFLDGISIEGMSTGTRVFNNISVDNGIGQGGFDLYVDDDGSVAGLVTDYNLLWKSVPGVVINVDNNEYSSIAAFAQATSHEDHGVGGNPRFVNPAAGDLHLLSGSSAIDSANAGTPGFQQADLEDTMPKDDLGVANTGAGVPPFADRGALEFDAPDIWPPDTTIAIGPADGSSTSSTNVSFEFTTNELGSTFECKLDAGAWQACISPRNYSGLADGPRTFSVRATDAANNTDQSPAIRNWTVDTIAPNTNIMAGPAEGSNTNSTNANFEFTSNEPGSTFDCKLDAGAWQACTSPKNYASLTDAPHDFLVRATDAVGNLDQSPAARSWRVDIAVPDTTITAGHADGSNTNSTNANFAFTSNKSGSTFECNLNDGGWGPCTSPQNYGGFEDGEHTFSVRATDSVGNVDTSPASRSWSVDTKAPNTKITKKPNGAVTARTARFAFKSTESDSTFRCKRNDRKWRKCTSPRIYENFGRGRHVFRVKAIDAQGNVDRTAARYVWRIVMRK